MTEEDQKELLKKIKEGRTLLLILVWQMWTVIAVLFLLYLFLRHH